MSQKVIKTCMADMEYTHEETKQKYLDEGNSYSDKNLIVIIISFSRPRIFSLTRHAPICHCSEVKC
jgi:hypothetical protein